MAAAPPGQSGLFPALDDGDLRGGDGLAEAAGLLVGHEDVDLLRPLRIDVLQDALRGLEDYLSADRNGNSQRSAVSEQEGLWIKNGGPTDDEWESYKNMLVKNCGMDKLLEVYQAAYDRYVAAE